MTENFVDPLKAWNQETTAEPFSDSERIPILEKILDRQMYFVNAGDTKTTILITVVGGFIAATVQAPRVTQFKTGQQMVSDILYIISVVLALVAIGALLRSTTPITRIKAIGDTKSLIFFGSIQAYGIDLYRQRLGVMSPKNYEDDLTTQIFINAIIARRKHRMVQFAIYFAMVSLVFYVCSQLLNQEKASGASLQTLQIAQLLLPPPGQS